MLQLDTSPADEHSCSEKLVCVLLALSRKFLISASLDNGNT